MPTLKGDSICSILKRNSLNPEMKIILYSSEDEDFLRETVETCGADGYIPKRTPPQLLVQRIKELLGS